VACHISLKSSWIGLQLCFRPHFNQRFVQEVMSSKVTGVPISKIRGQNNIWMQALWPSIENIIMGKVVASRKSEPWWLLWIHVCLWFVHAPKCSNYALANLLFGLCRSSWIIDSLITRPSPHPGTPTHPSTSKCCELKSVLQFRILPLFSLLNLQLSPSRNLGVRQQIFIRLCNKNI
jgi:hypothetical protein